MALDLSAQWHGAPVWVWATGGAVVGGVGWYVYKTRFAKSKNTASAPVDDTGSPTYGDAFGNGGPLGNLGDLVGSFTPPVAPPEPPKVETVDTTPPTPVDSGTIASIVRQVIDSVMPSQLPPAGVTPVAVAPTPAPQSTPAPPSPSVSVVPATSAMSTPLAGMPVATPGITQLGQYTVPSTWTQDIKDNPVLAAAFAPPDNTGKPYTFDSPVPDWQKFGFASEQQYSDANRIAVNLTQLNPPTVSEQIMAEAGDKYMTPFGPTDKANWEMGHALGRW